MTIHSADENWTMGTFNPKTHKVVPIEIVVIEGVTTLRFQLTPPTPPLSEPTEFGAMVEGKQMSNKYELTSNKKFGLTQIRALKDIGRFGIKKGDLGGWVQSELSLSQEGDAWVSGNARVYGNARVTGNAWVSGNALVEQSANLLLVSPIANGYSITLFRTEDGHRINIGCWSGSVDELLPKVRERRLSDQQVAEYELLVPFLQKRIESWKPVKTEKELK